MPDVLDPEPTDKRTNEWKAWKARQAGSEGPTTSLVADPNVFFSHFLGSLATSTFAKGVNGKGWEDLSRDAWHNFRRLIGWVASGQDVKDYEAREAAIKAILEREERQRRLDEEGEKALLEKRRLEHGVKV